MADSNSNTGSEASTDTNTGSEKVEGLGSTVVNARAQRSKMQGEIAAMKAELEALKARVHGTSPGGAADQLGRGDASSGGDQKTT